MEVVKSKDDASSRINKRMERLAANISVALAQNKKLSVAELNKAIGDFESRVERILESTDELDKIQEILNDKYYFPNTDSIVSYVQQAFSKKVAYNKNRRAVAWTAAKIVQAEGGLNRLKEDVSSFKRTIPRREAPVTNLYALSLEEIEKELSDTSKYPDMIAVKKALKGLLPSKKLSDFHSREGLIQAAIEVMKRTRSVSIFSRGSYKETGSPDDDRP